MRILTYIDTNTCTYTVQWLFNPMMELDFAFQISNIECVPKVIR